MKTAFRFQLILFFIFSITLGAYANHIHHQLKIKLEPRQHFIEVIDEITIPASLLTSDKQQINFLIHGELKVSAELSQIKLKIIEGKIDSGVFGVSNNISAPKDIPLQQLQFDLTDEIRSTRKLTLKYSGKIYHPIKQIGEEYARGFSETPGIIDTVGTVLAGASYWLPWFNNDLVSFGMEVDVPLGWDVVSQGKRTRHEIQNKRRIAGWDSPEIMDEVYLIAAPFFEYSRQVGAISAMAFLRSPDEALANKYLETTAQYLEMYQQLIGPYPYTKFALVENFWETGYGMPSFTLLGPKVIRFPFILHSSYPHELLHNWWGNSVFVDWEKGNWCEGLTVYQADHLIKEQRHQGPTYRRDALQGYTDYVKSSKDFPLIEFRSRHDAATAAVGYNKSMMVFNMLRQRFGDEKFTRAIQQFNRDNKFKKATFSDIRRAFESVTDEELTWYFDQWTLLTGAPELQISQARSAAQKDGYRVQFTLSQKQSGDIYRLLVPVAITIEKQKKAAWHQVEFTQQTQVFTLNCTGRPLRIDVDPQFDVFRRLDRNEIPPALSQIFGAEKATIILPDAGTDAQAEGYLKMAESWGRTGKITVLKESEVAELPKDQGVWLFGERNKFAKSLESSLNEYQVKFSGDSVKVEKQALPKADHSFVFSAPNPRNPEKTVAWLFTVNPQAISGLARKLPHYGKYSFLGFSGNEPTNVLKGQWPTLHSPLSIPVVQPDGQKIQVRSGKLPVRKALAQLKPVFSEKDLLKHVVFLADDALKGRGFGMPELDQAADYIADQFKQIGLVPGGADDSYFQAWEDTGGDPPKEATLKNVIGIIPGKNPAYQGQSVIVGAHYDHLGLGWPGPHAGDKGKIHNGADDNASGVAVMIELAKLLKSMNPARSIIFIAFTAEECGLRGSKYYVAHTKQYPADKIMGVLNLDTVGRLNNQKILILGGSSAREWVHIFRGIGFVTGIKHQMVKEELDASDQMSFIHQGIPAVQIFTGPNFDYHRPSDDIDKIDTAGMVKVAAFVKEAIQYLADREEPMTAAGKPAASGHPGKAGKPKAGRRVSLGTMPDFAFTGEGVRIGAVTPESPAAKAGLKKGDVLKEIDDFKIQKLADLSKSLKSYKPGDKILVKYVRAGKLHEVAVVLAAR